MTLEVGSWRHDTALEDDHATRLAKACVRDQQAFGLVFFEKKWIAHCPPKDQDRFEHLIEKTKDLI